MSHTGPVKRTTQILGRLDDGRILHKFRQSTLESLDVCLEKGRRILTDEMPRYETAPLSRGTAIHAGAEVFCRDLQMGYEPDYDYVHEVVHTEFSRLIATPNFDWQGTTEPTVRRFLDQSVDILFAKFSHLRPLEVEWAFNDLVIHEDDERVIVISGTADLFDAVRGFCDWKGASRPYVQWEKDRWGHQATVYTWAGLALGLLDPDRTEWPFTFFVFVNGAQVKLQEMTVMRHRGDHAWLRERVLDLSHLIEANLDVWPKQDNTALCSPKFCAAWDTCKGAHYSTEGHGWPKDSRPARPDLIVAGWKMEDSNPAEDHGGTT